MTFFFLQGIFFLLLISFHIHTVVLKPQPHPPPTIIGGESAI